MVRIIPASETAWYHKTICLSKLLFILWNTLNKLEGCNVTFNAYCYYFSKFVLCDVILKIIKKEHKMQFFQDSSRLSPLCRLPPFNFFCNIISVSKFCHFIIISGIACNFPCRDSFILVNSDFSAASYLRMLFDAISFALLLYLKLNIL